MSEKIQTQLAPEQITVRKMIIHRHSRCMAYPAAKCRETGLPMFCANDRKPGGLAENFQTAGERKRSGYPVKVGEQPKGWTRVANGYIPLYEKRA